MERSCKICGNSDGNRVVVAREMTFGTRDSFEYLECGNCGCVQLLEIPRDMAKYYPSGYYSLAPHGPFKRFLRRCWSANAYGRFNPVGRLFAEVFFDHRSMLAIRRLNPSKETRVLDVGCGRGNLLNDLAWLGFKNLTGVDPYLDSDIQGPNGVNILKRDVTEIQGMFDLIMLNHSFEHVPNPLSVMQAVSDHLAPDGTAIVGIPVASSFAYKQFGTNWCNFDAPRHFFLHTEKSIGILASKAGLRMVEIIHEGNDEQFWLSEQYSRNVAGVENGSLSSSVLKRLASWPRLRRDRIKARQLNEKREGDLVCFLLKRLA